MTNTAMQIANLMMSNGKNAADMTHAVKILGEGSMQRGFARIGDFFSTEVACATAKGLMRGRIQGGLVGIIGTAAVGGLVWWLTQDSKAVAHEAEGRTILRTMETARAPLSDIGEQEDPDGTVPDNIIDTNCSVKADTEE